MQALRCGVDVAPRLQGVTLMVFAFARVGVVIVAATGVLGCSSPGGAQDLASIKMPPGFVITEYARVPNARQMVLGPRGTLFVGTRKGEVYAVRDNDGDHRGEEVLTIASGLKSPNGVEFRDGALYVAEISRILKFDGIEENLANPPKPVVVSSSFPSDGHHGWKYIRLGPDGKLYVPVGAPCNICLREDPVYSSITRLNTDGSEHEVYAHGIRNTVGFDWHPETKQLWFTDNGRDWYGDDLPPDELNKVTRSGEHFGFPFVHGDDLHDEDYWEKRPEGFEYTKPVQNLGPHVAALGMRFYTGKMFPQEYHHQVFIAEHGSWNRSTKIGYRIMLVRLDDQQRAVSYEPFATGWLKNGSVWGRPVDVLVMPDGSMLVSDDHAGAIYRIAYSPEKNDNITTQGNPNAEQPGNRP